jgi:hypothetical protein
MNMVGYVLLKPTRIINEKMIAEGELFEETLPI